MSDRRDDLTNPVDRAAQDANDPGGAHRKGYGADADPTPEPDVPNILPMQPLEDEKARDAQESR